MLMEFTLIQYVPLHWESSVLRQGWKEALLVLREGGICDVLLQLSSFQQKCHRNQLAAFRAARRDGAGLLLNVSSWLWVRAQSKSCMLKDPVLTRNIPQISPFPSPSPPYRGSRSGMCKVSHLNGSLLLQSSTRSVWIFWKCRSAKNLTSGTGISISARQTQLGPSKLSAERDCLCFLMETQALSFT